MRRVGVGIAVAWALVLCACPGRGGDSVQEPPPPFKVGNAVSPLAEPPPPPADKDGLAYLELVYPALRDGWASFVNDCRLRLAGDHQLNATSLRAVVGMTIRRDGTLAEASLAEPSGEADFDGAALEIARDAAPYPAPPADLLSDDGLLHLSWAFHRDPRLAGMATAEIQRVTWTPERAIPAFLAAGAVDAAVMRLASELRSAGTNGGGLVGLTETVAHAAILQALASDDPSTRAAGIGAATRAKLAASGPRLVEIARSSADAANTRAAVAALGAVGAADAVPFLLELVAADSPAEPAVAVAAAESLEALGAGDRGRAALTARLAGTADERRLVLAVAAQVPLPDAIGELRGLVAGSGDRALRAAACTALGTAASAVTSKASAHSAIRAQLRDRDASLRAACARGAARAGGSSRATYWELVKLLKDRDERVRAEAVRAAAQLEPTRFTKELYVLRSESSPVVEAALADVLGAARVPSAVDKLSELAASEDARVRRAAAAALARRSEDAARARLAEMVADPDAEVRLRALVAAEGDALTGLLDSDDAALRTAALARRYADLGRAASLEDVVQRLARAQDAASRARIAGAWLAR